MARLRFQLHQKAKYWTQPDVQTLVGKGREEGSGRGWRWALDESMKFHCSRGVKVLHIAT